MDERNTPKQPHEFKPAKMEAVVGTVKNLSAEKIDLVLQKLTRPMDGHEESEECYFLRFWRLAEGQVTLQEIPMTERELRKLGIAIWSQIGRTSDEFPRSREMTFRHDGKKWAADDAPAPTAEPAPPAAKDAAPDAPAATEPEAPAAEEGTAS